VNLSHEGLSLWYGTPDAPAPDQDEWVARRGASIVVGVSPANPTNTVVVRYRVDGGLIQSAPGRELRTDYQKQAQYFAVTLPAITSGQVVEYSPVLSCAGRQVPAPHVATAFPSRFRLTDERSRAGASDFAGAGPAGLRYPTRLDFVATVALQFEDVQFVGDTPAGMRVNFLVRDGRVEGDGVRARVTRGSSDQMIVRRDGMGVVRIRAGFETDDGAMLDVEAGGYVDFGADGYRRALARTLPDRSPLVVSPLISTRHATYHWLNRVQCVGTGYTHLDAGRASYDVYTAIARDVPATR
jgi:hypothetical protein